MKCKSCNCKWGDPFFPVIVKSYRVITRTPIVGIKHRDALGHVIFDTDELGINEVRQGFDLWYECEKCGQMMCRDEVLTISEYLEGQINEDK